jgi:ubiquinone/menaquinone biosynthesis C-methylase UbiE
VKIYSHWLFPRVLDLIMRRKELVPFRRRIGEAATGRVLDLGVGSGLNLALYRNAERIIGIDPSLELLQLARARAREAFAVAPIELVHGSAEALPLDDHSIDTAVSTFTLCSVDDPEKALTEIRRVLKPAGRLLFAEHGRLPELRGARWQDRLTPAWSRIAGGCHLNRKPDDLMKAAGFHVDALETTYLKGPRILGYVYSGSARAG